MAMSVRAGPAQKILRIGEKIFRSRYHSHKSLIYLISASIMLARPEQKKEQNRAKIAFHPPFFPDFFAFCRQATCTPNLVRA
ncbi:hypothetical protein [Achromobacter xylosoxidans]|uniref:Uncharacterized protein n=2 Tax=Alcaligenes xylosoxydans xylosoxydans TaxID=85698 RepID=A0A424W792_ALCXX|nr:hypothetical protein [Achromobacter xylosoxidans]MBC9908134.1 hypothetical protein [Achromobacter xylosoxidans]MBD0871741.1 hypothetical protein [Achromobacter xylosoxidans]QNP87175.1 hypothetical protein IAG39_06575 [Achromobacter xylosoxidans]RPJ89081.1 hypothetical protein DY367_24420 [Achromobacter xylosoxidans]